MKLVVCGDSWTFGSEIRDPLLPKSIKDWDSENDPYRLSKIWPTLLGNILGIEEVINLSYPGVSNDYIVRKTKDWLIEYISDNKPTDELFLIIGFTSPERREFYYRDDDMHSWITIWPMLHDPTYMQTDVQKFHDLYAKRFWNAEEYVHRYVNQLLDLQNFCQVYKIKHLFFQAFYQHSMLGIQNWKDDKYINQLTNLENIRTWNLIDPIRFMRKNEINHSFHNYITAFDTESNSQIAINGQHPSPTAHMWWAEEINRYCAENKLW